MFVILNTRFLVFLVSSDDVKNWRILSHKVFQSKGDAFDLLNARRFFLKNSVLNDSSVYGANLMIRRFSILWNHLGSFVNRPNTSFQISAEEICKARILSDAFFRFIKIATKSLSVKIGDYILDRSWEMNCCELAPQLRQIPCSLERKCKDKPCW